MLHPSCLMRCASTVTLCTALQQHTLLLTCLAFTLRIINDPESHHTPEAHSTADNYWDICRLYLRAQSFHLTRALQHAQNAKPAARSQSAQDVPPMERFVTAVQTQPWHESSSVSKSHCTGHTGQGRGSRVTLPVLEHLPGSGKASSSHGVPQPRQQNPTRTQGWPAARQTRGSKGSLSLTCLVLKCCNSFPISFL